MGEDQATSWRFDKSGRRRPAQVDIHVHTKEGSMKDVLQRLLITGAAVVALGLAPQVYANQSSEGIPCRLQSEDLEKVCAASQSDIIRTENIDNNAISICGCPNRGITVEQCSDAVCSNLEGPQILAPNASRVSYGHGLQGSTCRNETICPDPPIGGDLVCQTVKICKD